jgi:hypothetical protein
MPGRIWTEENAARRRPGGAGPDELPGVTTSLTGWAIRSLGAAFSVFVIPWTPTQ